MDTETVINLSDTRTLYSCDKGQIGQLKRLGVPVHRENEYGTWFDLSTVTIAVKVNKSRGNGYKEIEL